jgi:hypothetical protein
MIRTVEAIVDEHGCVRLLERVSLPEARRALGTIFHSALANYAASERPWIKRSRTS